MSDAHELRLERVMDVPRDKVWQCWSDLKLLEKWFCPKPWYVTDVRIDLKPGGEFSTVMHGPDGEEFANTGVVLAVEPGRLVRVLRCVRARMEAVGQTLHGGTRDAGGCRRRAHELHRRGTALDRRGEGRTRGNGFS